VVCLKPGEKAFAAGDRCDFLESNAVVVSLLVSSGCCCFVGAAIGLDAEVVLGVPGWLLFADLVTGAVAVLVSSCAASAAGDSSCGIVSASCVGSASFSGMASGALLGQRDFEIAIMYC
jgi:hypothetical protein